MKKFKRGGGVFISGFSFARNLVKYDYPFIESIKSLLPIVDEFVIVVGDSEDNTLELVESINDKKIKIIKSIWNKGLAKDGLIYSEQTNIALANCNDNADWAFYIQGDEVIHEKDYDLILKSLEKYKDNKDILGLMLKYIHFKGDYFSVDPYQYRRAVRIVRPGGVVISVGDAYGFARSSDGLFLDKSQSNLVRIVNAFVYHYGWVKSLEARKDKFLIGVDWYRGGIQNPEDINLLRNSNLIPEGYFILKEFTESHPSVMKDRVKFFPRLSERRSRWLNPEFYRHILKHGFKG
jgi:glycosyltransferase involved in cell wall biosynthesis